jgi:hypothetical protein
MCLLSEMQAVERIARELNSHTEEEELAGACLALKVDLASLELVFFIGA